MIQQTSLEAYIEVLKRLGRRQREILEVFKRYGTPLSNKKVSELINQPINRITPRVLELRQKGLLQHNGNTIENGRTVMLWSI